MITEADNTGTSLNYGKRLAYAVAVGTAFLAPIQVDNYDLANISHYGSIPQKLTTERSWEVNHNVSFSSIDDTYFQEIEQRRIIATFSKNLIQNSHDLDDEILEVLEQNFWDLI